MKHLIGPSILLTIGMGLTATCAVANAEDFPDARYEVSGAGVAESISWQTALGQQHATNVPLPWSTEFESFGGQVFLLSAQGPGSISCRILLDRNVVTQQTATGVPARTVCTH